MLETVPLYKLTDLILAATTSARSEAWFDSCVSAEWNTMLETTSLSQVHRLYAATTSALGSERDVV